MKYVALLAVASFASLVHAQHVDIDLELINGQITTNTADGPERVFGSDLGEIFPDFTDEPGFDCEVGTFPFPSEIDFMIHGALKKWDGQTLTQIAAERMDVGYADNAGFLRTTPETDTTVMGFALPVGANGTWHRHLEYTLGAPASDGVYMIELSLSLVGSGQRSETIYLVFNQNSPETEHDAAIDWVRANLIPPACPADWDRSGGVDGDDVIAFFADWDQSTADFNDDGGTDGDDVIAFFARWDANC